MQPIISLKNNKQNLFTTNKEEFMRAIYRTILCIFILINTGLSTTINVPGDYSTIQDAINAAASSDTINIAAGTYNETLNLLNKSLYIEGAGSSLTIIDAHEFTGYAIQNFGDNSAVKNLKLIGTGSAPSSYGFKVSGTDGLILNNIVVENSYKTGIDLNTVSDAVLKNIEVRNTSYGFGLMILNSHRVVVDSITTNGNAWGGVSVQTSKPVGTDSVIFIGNFDAAESHALLIEQDPDAGIYFPPTNIHIPDKFHYIVYDFRNPENYKQWYHFETVDNAKASAQTIAGYPMYSNVVAYDIAEANYYVAPGMKIQDAVDAADNTDVINVDAGTFTEQISISKNIILNGSGKDVTKIVSPPVLATSFTTKKAVVLAHDTDNVVIKNITVDGAGLGNGNYQFTGIGFHRAGGTIDSVEVKGMHETPAVGTQHGASIYAWNDSCTTRNISVTNCIIHDYQKAGIVLNGEATNAIVTKNIITGLGPVPFIAQNGIQLGFGASGIIDSNIVSGNVWTGTYGGSNDPITDPNSDASAGILFYLPGSSAGAYHNTLTGNQFGIAAVGAQLFNLNYNSIVGLEHDAYVYPIGIAVWSSDQWTEGFGGSETGTLAYFQNNTITDHDYGIVVFDYKSDNIMPRDNTISNNRLFGAWSNATVDAIRNWWGSPTGPSPQGLGDAISDSISVYPWYINASLKNLVVAQVQVQTQDSVSVGPEGSKLTIGLVSIPDSNNYLILYQSGIPTDTPITGENFPTGIFRRTALIWGIIEIGNDTANITLDYNGFPGINFPSTLSVIKRAAADSSWIDVSSQFVNDTINRKFTATGISSFSEFSIGSTAGDLTEVKETAVNVAPRVFMLHRNYPNPFNPSTTLQFSLEKDGWATLRIYNLLGQKVATLFEGNGQAGRLYNATFNASGLASGVYIARLEGLGQIKTQRLMLVK
jgi:hypothetical protein